MMHRGTEDTERLRIHHRVMPRTGHFRTFGRSYRSEAEHLPNAPHAYQRMARQHNPYGDGKASERIADLLAGGTAEFARIRLGDHVPVKIQTQASCS